MVRVYRFRRFIPSRIDKMYLKSLTTAVPAQRYTQRECWEIFRRSQAGHRLKSRSVSLMEKILLRDNGIQSRHFAVREIESIFDYSPEELNRIYEESATSLGVEALESAMAQGGLEPASIDALYVCTCTGYVCPGLSSFISERAGLGSGMRLLDFVGMGCGAALPTLQSASDFIAANPEKRIAVVAVEICSAAFYLDDDPGVLISACLFGDGAAAAIWSGNAEDGESLSGFRSVHLPEKRELLRFENRNGYLRNRLHKTVPEEAARAVRHLHGQSELPESYIIPHSGGRDVLNAMGEVLPQKEFPESRNVLRNYGNMSSPSVLFALKNHLGSGTRAESPVWITSFGAGFSAHSAVFGDGLR